MPDHLIFWFIGLPSQPIDWESMSSFHESSADISLKELEIIGYMQTSFPRLLGTTGLAMMSFL